MNTLTIAYITCRKDPKIDWFIESLARQTPDIEPTKIDVLSVDFHAADRTYQPQVMTRLKRICAGKHEVSFQEVPPMANVWNGPHRLTKENWFNAAAARNTALCLAPDGWIAYVDDLSVLAPGWLLNVVQAMKLPGVTLGAYRKVKNLVVKDGEIVSYDNHDKPGFNNDSRWIAGADSGAVPCNGDMLYGCSLVGPVEAFLQVNGWPESICGGLGFEDVAMGTVMANAGTRFWYNRNMLTIESDDHHGLEPAFRRESFEKHPNDVTDKGHAVLNMVKGGMKVFPDHWGDGGIRKLREEVLAGKPFPVPSNPQHEFHTGKLLSEL